MTIYVFEEQALKKQAKQTNKKTQTKNQENPNQNNNKITQKTPNKQKPLCFTNLLTKKKEVF